MLHRRRPLLGMRGASHTLWCAMLLPGPATVCCRPHGCWQHSALLCLAIHSWSPRLRRRVQADAGRTRPELPAAAGWRGGIVHLTPQPALLLRLVRGREHPAHCAAARALLLLLLLVLLRMQAAGYPAALPPPWLLAGRGTGRHCGGLGWLGKAARGRPGRLVRTLCAAPMCLRALHLSRPRKRCDLAWLTSAVPFSLQERRW